MSNEEHKKLWGRGVKEGSNLSSSIRNLEETYLGEHLFAFSFFECGRHMGLAIFDSETRRPLNHVPIVCFEDGSVHTHSEKEVEAIFDGTLKKI